MKRILLKNTLNTRGLDGYFTIDNHVIEDNKIIRSDRIIKIEENEVECI